MLRAWRCCECVRGVRGVADHDVCGARVVRRVMREGSCDQILRGRLGSDIPASLFQPMHKSRSLAWPTRDVTLIMTGPTLIFGCISNDEFRMRSGGLPLSDVGLPYLTSLARRAPHTPHTIVYLAKTRAWPNLWGGQPPPSPSLVSPVSV